MDTEPLGVSPVVCFMDESATDDQHLDDAVVGGIVLHRPNLHFFNEAWQRVLAKHGLPTLHMRELGPNGPCPHLVGEACVALLADAVRVINTARIFTFGASARNRIHERFFPEPVRHRFMSVYKLAVMMAIEINRATAVREGYRGTIDYVLDDNNRFRRQVSETFDSLRPLSEAAKWRLGSVEFVSDALTPALQAADVVAWATRRRKSWSWVQTRPSTPHRTLRRPLCRHQCRRRRATGDGRPAHASRS